LVGIRRVSVDSYRGGCKRLHTQVYLAKSLVSCKSSLMKGYASALVTGRSD
jgi:hypothetical protein